MAVGRSTRVMVGRTRRVAIALSALMLAGASPLASSVSAQDASAGPAPANDRFRSPVAADLATDATRSVVDVPAQLPDEIDLQPLADAAVDRWDPLVPAAWE